MRERSVVQAAAKVNLRLLVLAREETGYHALETIFCAISLADEIVLEPAGPGIDLRVEGEVDTGPPEENLVVLAATRFYQELRQEPAIRVTLRKRIPSAAGLGGGSSDAAAVLRGLNSAHGDAFPTSMLMQWGSELGSDVPFFLCGSPLALAWSRGERLLPLPPLPSRPVLVAHPGTPLPTGKAFRRIAERRGGEYRPHANVISSEQLSDWRKVAQLAANDFGPIAEESIPVITDGLRVMRSGGAGIALLAGSGASIFGIFESGAGIDGCVAELQRLGFTCWSCATLEGMSLPPTANLMDDPEG